MLACLTNISCVKLEAGTNRVCEIPDYPHYQQCFMIRDRCYVHVNTYHRKLFKPVCWKKDFIV